MKGLFIFIIETDIFIHLLQDICHILYANFGEEEGNQYLQNTVEEQEYGQNKKEANIDRNILCKNENNIIDKEKKIFEKEEHVVK